MLFTYVRLSIIKLPICVPDISKLYIGKPIYISIKKPISRKVIENQTLISYYMFVISKWKIKKRAQLPYLC